MTLISSFSFEQHPFVVGDIMLSCEDNGYNLEPFNIPTRKNVNAIALPSTGYIVAGLSQKVTQLSKRLIVAWTGSANSAYKVTKDLYGEKNHNTFGMIEKKLSIWQRQSGFDPLYMIGIYISKRNVEMSEVTFFDWDSKNGIEGKYSNIPNYGNCYFGGSGGDSFRNILYKGIRLKFTGNVDNQFHRGLLVSLSHLANMMGEQMRLGFGVDQLFGGGYECASFINGQLQKITDISYHFWDATPERSGNVTLGIVATLKIGYFEDYLLIRKLKFSSNQNNIKNELYIIRPPYRIVTDDEKLRIESKVIWPELTSRISVFYVHFPKTAYGQEKVCSFANMSQSDDGAVKYQIEDGDLEMIIEPEILQRINKLLK